MSCAIKFEKERRMIKLYGFKRDVDEKEKVSDVESSECPNARDALLNELKDLKKKARELYFKLDEICDRL